MPIMVSFNQLYVTLLLGTFFFGFLQAEAPAQSTTETSTESALSAANFSFWRDYIRATDAELGWQKLPWQMSFHKGLKEAAQSNKPVLLWAMNGHPLGCT